MDRVPILHGALVLLRGESEHRSSTMEAVILFSEEERRICYVLPPFQAAGGAVIHLRGRGRVRLFIPPRGGRSLHAATSYARAAKYSWQNLPRHTRSLFAQVITAMNVSSERLRTPWKLGGQRRGGMVAVARNGKECTRRELVATGFALRPPSPFNL